MIVSTGTGIWSTSTVQWRPQSERWAADVTEMLGGVLRHTCEEDYGADGPSGRTP